MHIFFARNEITLRCEFPAYLLYYLLYGLLHLLYPILVVNLLVSLFLLYCITALYSSSIIRRALAIIYIHALLISLQAITDILFSTFQLNRFIHDIDIELILSLIVAKVLAYVAVFVMDNHNMLKTSIKIAPSHWLAIVGIPSGALFITFILIMESNETNQILILLGITILFLINFYVFYLYDVLLQFYQAKMERHLLEQQNLAYAKQLKIIAQSQESMRMVRHDMKLHISTLQGLIESEHREQALEYIQSIYAILNFTNGYAHSNYSELDSIVNYKSEEARRLGIKVNLNIKVPERLNVQPIDIVIIIGNLLDNAIEAAYTLEVDKWIELSVEFDRNVLYIQIRNPYGHDILVVDQKLKTTHQDKENHGLGLCNVRRSLAKYNGSLHINHSEGIFSAEALLYNPADL